jgi:basic membrane lipoprotein Med (substrate-binding protein (PBP1-ABC) superfamily)
VAAANPRARVYVDFIGSWYDFEKEKTIALSLIDKGCDVITHSSDSDATGEAAEKTGTYFISFCSNTARFFPHVFLTGGVYDWEPIMTAIAESVHNGSWQTKPENVWVSGLADGGVKLAPFSDLVPSNVSEEVSEKQKAIVQGDLEVFPGLSYEDLMNLSYLEPNVVGNLPESQPFLLNLSEILSMTRIPEGTV